MIEPTSQQLIDRCRRGDTGAQQELYRQYNAKLFTVCLRFARDRPEAQDMLQETFLVIFRDLGQFRGEGAFEAWMHRVTVRCALQHLRRKNPLRFAEDFNNLPADTWNEQPDTELNSEVILRMVQELPDGYRTIFNLYCIEAYTYPEIAGELGISESSVRSQYSRACKSLRTRIDRWLTGVF